MRGINYTFPRIRDSVFLTGGAMGIGRSVTGSVGEKSQGEKVLFCGIDAEVGKATEAELQKQYGADNVGFVQCDVTDADQLQVAFDAAVKKFGAVEICANNAGILDQSRWEKMIDINMTAQIRGSEIALEHMRRDKGVRGGVIINTVATKFAMIGYMTNLAADPDMVAMGVRWGCFCPMAVDTQLIDVKEGAVRKLERFHKAMEGLDKMKTEVAAKAFIHQLEDVENNGKLMVVDPNKGPLYRRRVIVDEDGVSNPIVVDNPCAEHPPVPGHKV
ncbi:hypothetical protein ACOMHN_042486 [Nucella lapillus]